MLPVSTRKLILDGNRTRVMWSEQQFVILIMFAGLVNCHINVDRKHLSELKKHCEHAYICFHDAVIVCGKSVNEARTFLDLCDLYEYSCEYNMVFRHVKDEEGVCPNPKELAPGFG